MPPGGTAEHEPDCDAPQVPVPEQQSAGLAQPSPICRHASARQVPATQLSVQQSPGTVQASPAGLQNSLVVQTGWPPAVSAAQVPEQQFVCPAVQAMPSATQVVEPWVQTFPSQRPAQQGVPPAVHACWSARHWVPVVTQAPAKQESPLQQGFEASQAAPWAEQLDDASQVPAAEQESPVQQAVAPPQVAPWAAQTMGSWSLPPEPPPQARREIDRKRDASSSWARRE